MILHLATDEKFIDHAIDMFETTAPGENHFFVDSQTVKSQLKYINNKENISVINLSSPKAFNEFCSKINDYEFIVLHCLFYNALRIIPYAGNNTKIVWMLFGTEVYSLPEFQYLATITDTAFSKVLNKATSLLKQLLTFAYYAIIKRNISRPRLFRSVAGRIDYLANFNTAEFEFISSKIPQLNCKWLSWNYGTMKESKSTVSLQKNILLGNSATKTNNHIDALKRLKRLNPGTRKIIVFLSYGSERYKRKIIKYAHKLFPDNFLPIVDFMPREEYMQLLKSCDIIIMNHLRQQALGNIFASLAQGAKVYLRETTTVFKYFKRAGCHIFSISKDLTFDNPTALSPLTRSQRQQNQNIMKQEFSREIVLKKTAVLIRTVRDDILKAKKDS